MKKSILFALTFLATISFVSAQKFMPVFDQQWGKLTYVVKNDDSKVWGKATSGSIGPNGMMSITLKDTVSGEKKKFKVPDIKEVGVSAKGTLGKIEAMTGALQNAGSISEMARTDYKSVLNADFYVYRRIVDKKGKPRMLQLLNPGFETKMQVYADPKANESNGGLMTSMAAGMEKSYYVARGNSSATYVEKKKYKKSMSSVFDDCSTILEAYKADFSEFATHVFYYENECN